MKKKELLKSLDYSSYTAMIVASVLVLVFEFVAIDFILRLAVILYSAAFLMLSVLCSTRLVFLFKGTKENDAILVEKNKSTIVWNIVRGILGIACFVFTIIFLVMF